MFKKVLINSIAIAASLLATSTHAITIINENGQSVKYTIADSTACTVNYTNGEIGPGGQIVWTRNIAFHPSSVCVHATGFTSTTGAYAYGVNNEGCVLKVKDAGFMRGIKIEKVSGC